MPSNDAIRDMLEHQYHGALDMLRQTIERCPDDLWTATGDHPCAFWHVAYHTIFYTHFYLHTGVDAFVPWEKHRRGIQYLLLTPDGPRTEPVGDPYSKADVLAFWKVCDDFVRPALVAMDLDAPECGFPWYPMPKLEHQFVNLRHVAHHTGVLAARLRAATDAGIDWVKRHEAVPDA